ARRYASVRPRTSATTSARGTSWPRLDVGRRWRSARVWWSVAWIKSAGIAADPAISPTFVDPRHRPGKSPGIIEPTNRKHARVRPRPEDPPQQDRSGGWARNLRARRSSTPPWGTHLHVWTATAVAHRATVPAQCQRGIQFRPRRV